MFNKELNMRRNRAVLRQYMYRHLNIKADFLDIRMSTCLGLRIGDLQKTTTYEVIVTSKEVV